LRSAPATNLCNVSSLTALEQIPHSGFMNPDSSVDPDGIPPTIHFVQLSRACLCPTCSLHASHKVHAVQAHVSDQPFVHSRVGSNAKILPLEFAWAAKSA